MKWSSAKTVLEIMAIGIGIPTALVASVALVPGAWRVTHERNTDYEMLRRIHAGYSVDFITARLGTPTIVTRIANDRSVEKQLLYIKREYAVSVLSDGAGSAVSFAVFACNRNFKPSFVSPVGATIQLNSTPLDETFLDGSSEEAGPEDRHLHYSQDATATSVGQLVEMGVVSGSGAALGRSYMLGVNAACGASVDYGRGEVPFVTEDFIGAERRSLDKFRSTEKPNFYFESVRSDARVNKSGCLVLEYFTATGDPRPDAILESEDGGCIGASALRSDLPEEFKRAEDPEFFRNLWG